MGGECWTQVGAVPSGLLCVWPAQSGSLHSSCSSVLKDRVLKECLVSIKKSCTGNVFVVSCDV